ncbi:MAG TPA: hypothetical protein DCY88_19900 [Cyanobacteria bacterium UBA11372]|nr:hypothetical protein [Cyanobacteria bacterium UBA11372]
MPSLIGTDANEILTVPGGNSNLTGYTVLGVGGKDTLVGGGGRDKLVAASGSSLLIGGNGNDQLYGSFGDDTENGGNGDDLLFGDFGNDYLVGESGNDRMFGGFGDDLIFGGDGNDTMDGSVGSDVLFGGAGDDVITGGTNGALDAPPGFFEDYLVGGSGSDILNGFGGGTGNTEIDWLIGGGAVDADGFVTDISPDGFKDTFVLGDSSSVYYASRGADDYALIFDFESGIDKLRLKSGVTYTPRNADFNGDGITDTGLFAQVSGAVDLIAIFNGGVSLTSTDITFV